MRGGAVGAPLVLASGGRRFALAAAGVAEVAPDQPAEPVPLAPSAIAGIALHHGRLLTVLELDRMLELAPDPMAPVSLVLLAAPFAHLALRVRGRIDLDPVEEAGAPPPEPLDVEGLVAALELRLSMEVG